MKPTTWISNLKLKYKILILTLPLLALLCLVICLANITYFTHLYEADARNSAESWMNVAANTFDQRWQEILYGILDVAGSNELRVIVSDLVSGNDTFLKIQSSLQSPIQRMTNSSTLISNTYFIDDDGDIYAGYTDRIQNPGSTLLDYSQFENLQRITFLGATTSPFDPSKTVIPIAIPLSILGVSNYLVLADNGIDVVMVCLLNFDTLHAELNKGRSSYFDSSCFLYSSDGEVLLFPSDVTLLEDSDYTVLSQETAVEGLDIALAISISSYLPKKLALIFFCLAVALVVIAIGSVAIFSISSFLTRPFNNLMRMIDEIKRNCYRQDVIPRFHDETGALIQAINSMYVTIQDQISLIRKTEKEKYHYMEQILTEQINPHFIYNTLETINMEILNGNTDTASSLVRSFATFLRCNLNNGNDLTTFEDELRQATAYMEIMNQRLNNKISFSCDLSHPLKRFVIPKSILQPMIENSIKHGFNNGMQTEGILLPAISIDIQEDDGSVIITVTDNGKGIDIENAQEAATSPKGYNHVGLRNIYKRIELYFGVVDMRFTSIPYFQNSIIITFPKTTLTQEYLS